MVLFDVVRDKGVQLSISIDTVHAPMDGKLMRVQILFGKEMQFFAAVVAGVGGGLLQTHCEELNWCQGSKQVEAKRARDGVVRKKF